MELKIGSEGEGVKWLQHILNEQGYGPFIEDGDFGPKTESALQEFQGGHIDMNRRPLKPDGEVGPRTEWALRHPTRENQRHWLTEDIPAGIEGARAQILRAAFGEHAKGVKEEPEGSNWGPEVKKYGGQPGWPWCCLYFSWITKEALGHYAMGRSMARVFDVYTAAKKKGWWRDKNDYTPIPGDAFVMLYKNSKGQLTGKGHIGFVVQVAGNGKSFNTNEGNCGNAVKNGTRRESQTSLLGYVNFYPPEEQPLSWVRGGLPSSEDVSNDGTR